MRQFSLALILAAAASVAAQPAPLDIGIINARLINGVPGIAGAANVGVRNGRIEMVDAAVARGARLVIDAGGQVVAPGFIDAHSHGLETLGRPDIRDAKALLAQGVTTIVGNPDGSGPVDLAKQAADLEANGGIGVNVALLIGHGSVRSAVMGGANRAPTADELERMRALVRKGVADGAFGLSSGLFYTPGRFATTEEVIDLAKAAGGVYMSHIRDEGDYAQGVVASVDEVIRIADEAKVVGIVSHMKALGPDNWGRSKDLIAHIDAARRRGVRVWADQYPYEASSTGLGAAVLPDAGAAASIREALADPAKKAKLLADAKENIRRRGGAHSIQIASGRGAAPEMNGKRLDDIAGSHGVTPEQMAVDIVLAGGASIVSFNMSEDDIRAIMRQPWTMTSSDGALSLPGPSVPHPRNNGAFARKLGVYVRERKVLSLEEAVRSMTSLPAQVFGFKDRGELRTGAIADIVVFDPATIVDHATYERPHQLSTGVSWVIVNGVVEWRNGQPTGARAGVVLKR
ncbi:MAG: D-aminoacylase [Acidobacteria bacterium]|nr:MAG: D-aminoacylase [Acidobacteriota bacterium]